MRSLHLAIACVTVCVAGCSRQTSETPQNALGAILQVKSQTLAQTGTAQAYQAADLLTNEDIREITGHSVVKRTPTPAMGIYQNGCEWELEGKAGINWSIVIGVMSPGGRRYFDTYLHLDGQPPIPGLGDIAISDMSDRITAVKGDTLVDLNYIDFSPGHQDFPKRLVERILSRLK